MAKLRTVKMLKLAGLRLRLKHKPYLLLLTSFIMLFTIVIIYLCGHFEIKEKVTNPDSPLLFDYKGAMSKLNELKVSQDDPRLIQLIRDYYILSPSTEPYHLHIPDLEDYSSKGVSRHIDAMLQHKENGFFIECGAFDGEFKSTTLYLEKKRHWTGLLLEADPLSFARLRSKNRKAYMINACLNTEPYPAIVTFNAVGEVGRVIDGASADVYLKHMRNRRNELEIQCFPLYSILLALNQINVDFFGLDIEGAEANVLQTVPWKMVNISTMLIEYAHIDEGLKPLQTFLEHKGYRVIEKLEEDIIVKKIH